MLKKLQTYFPTAITTSVPPTIEGKEFYWFKEERNDSFWLGVPKLDINQSELELLSTLYERVSLEQSVNLAGSAKEWFSFLFNKENLPVHENSQIRFIQFQINSMDQGIKNTEMAIKEFFHKCLAFIWLDEFNGVIIEEKNELAYSGDDFQSISITLESDFYIKSRFYIGKFRNGTKKLRDSFFLEREIFFEALNHSTKERIFTFENIFPTLLAVNLPSASSILLHNDVIQTLKDDSELRETMEVFLESHSNTSLAAKKLYVHRNTLQYRLNRFSEKTTIDLKNINSILTVYIACLLAKNLE
ncbi:PucR family transcriptional regulator [Bacillus tuaregi]|uniref:PucR family transcriptional regulator n=1 Tax=Bacillus tuaregi TaxID=1816695 RepID=UPI0008F958A1|nr:helix-turn-helix domain-containing protein [Bacillus tuaregi]